MNTVAELTDVIARQELRIAELEATLRALMVKSDWCTAEMNRALEHAVLAFPSEDDDAD